MSEKPTNLNSKTWEKIPSVKIQYSSTKTIIFKCWTNIVSQDPLLNKMDPDEFGYPDELGNLLYDIVVTHPNSFKNKNCILVDMVQFAHRLGFTQKTYTNKR
jgi:hypothetical protein